MDSDAEKCRETGKILVRTWVAKFQGALVVSAEQLKVSNIAKSSRGPRCTSHDNDFA